jgi:hypothetical protein
VYLRWSPTRCTAWRSLAVRRAPDLRACERGAGMSKSALGDHRWRPGDVDAKRRAVDLQTAAHSQRPVRLGFRLEEEFFLRTRHSGAPYCRRSGLDLR